MHILLRFLWPKQWHGVYVFHFLDILKSFDRCDTCIKYIHVLFYCNSNLMFVLCTHALNVSIALIVCWKISLEIQV
jgi:hypothetical protein